MILNGNPVWGGNSGRSTKGRLKSCHSTSVIVLFPSGVKHWDWVRDLNHTDGVISQRGSAEILWQRGANVKQTCGECRPQVATRILTETAAITLAKFHSAHPTRGNSAFIYRKKWSNKIGMCSISIPPTTVKIRAMLRLILGFTATVMVSWNKTAGPKCSRRATD